MIILPAIDLIDGKCVRLVQGDFARRTDYRNDPVDAAKEFADAGLTHLHLVDLDGARGGNPVHLHVLEAIARDTSLVIDFGGGMSDVEQVRAALDAGAAQVVLGSMALRAPETFFACLSTFGQARIVLSADGRAGKIATAGWSAQSDVETADLVAQFVARGVLHVQSTDIARDGMMEGPATELYRSILARTTCALVASGGVRDMDDIRALAEAGCAGVIVGRALYEGRITLEQLARVC
jgi:phosphoribosylformimino-5-aminoimidazole carboxamide ribotide isomerase